MSNVAAVDKSGDRVRRMFGEIAPRYDLLNHLLSGNVDRYWRWRTTRIVPPATTGPLADAPILDLCTGTGDLALAYDRAARGKLRITAADFCPEMLQLGKAKGAKRGLNDRIEWVEADANSLPFASDTYQLVTAAFGLRNVSDTDAGLREMTRVCRRGGKVAVLEFTTPRWQPFKAFYGWYFRNVLPRIGQAVMRNSTAAYEYLPESVKGFYEYEQLTERMTSAGLANVRYHPLTLGIATLYVGEKK
ncbi:bifunctional demethylmenaquinone methyltransferase/2-methoxy-6-polyprenyl-1,4-benzoquinol methylase UbiE [Botrimarina mediterranea]|uniref:Demethylmenaquinone methyltransferase n=1 Tax=Botrimarina mediterranea TaxID=2528022 RepID=A0A518KDM2_9BACT|nr:bifunctional demethylmenaquinone methyltransferase/2-methoxy-6-polyprenyl-1,4-benzoquinol methylase UbiE [Botrimarina mediterranea]QDV75893.1 UbiE/COQ5 methyltransferase [Botrimarina mediterranea]QDV80488.1 UbiE/COQ5 methyltransferase [Planctomycetes bacterium K2D]